MEDSRPEDPPRASDLLMEAAVAVTKLETLLCIDPTNDLRT